MNLNPNSPATAKIYQFPTKISANAGQRARQPQSAPDHRALQLPAVEFGSGWYHEAALQTEITRKS
jgi:Protein of unknown function (DUF2735)